MFADFQVPLYLFFKFNYYNVFRFGRVTSNMYFNTITIQPNPSITMFESLDDITFGLPQHERQEQS